MPPEMPVILVRWEALLGEILDRTQRFPKAVRFTFTSRIDNRAINVLEKLIEARFAKVAGKERLLAAIDVDLDCLRALLRISHARRYLDHAGYESLARGLDEVGHMVGGWTRYAAGRDGNP